MFYLFYDVQPDFELKQRKGGRSQVSGTGSKPMP